VQERIKNGGHSVPEETIRRRYQSGLKKFFNLYLELADSWQLFDNSDSNLMLIASKTQKNDIMIKDIEIWEKLLEISREKR
jgi:predicted ABC-type ATPase